MLQITPCFAAHFPPLFPPIPSELRKTESKANREAKEELPLAKTAKTDMCANEGRKVRGMVFFAEDEPESGTFR